LAGPTSRVRGQPREFAFVVQLAGTYRSEIDWNGDGTVDETRQASESLSLTHVFPTAGNYQVSVKVSTLDGHCVGHRYP